MKPFHLSALVLLVNMVFPSTAIDAASVHVRVHQHDRHHMKYRPVTVVGPNEVCPQNGGDVVICSSVDYACQSADDGTSTCLPRDTSFLDTIDDQTAAPWQNCSFTNASLPSKCLFDYVCLCDDVYNKECTCRPPDAYRLNRGNVATGCVTSDGQVGKCDATKYCRTKDNKQECADAPYLPGIPLYGRCDGDFAGECVIGTECRAFKAFSMCVASS